MQWKNVADSVSGFLFSFQLKLSLLFFCSIDFWLLGRRNLVVVHLDLPLHETQTVFVTSKLLKQTKTSETKIILGGVRTRDIWIRSQALNPMDYEDFGNLWVSIAKSEWYWDEGTLHLLFFFFLIYSDRQNQDYISILVPAVFGEKIVSCSCKSCCFVGRRAISFIAGYVMSNVLVSVLESFCVLFTLEVQLWETNKFDENEFLERNTKNFKMPRLHRLEPILQPLN